MTDSELLRWALADQAFAEADALAAHLIGIKTEQGSQLFAACCTGIATSYFRPFVGAAGLGELPESFKNLTKFDDLAPFDARFLKIHRMLRDTRNKFGGHFDLVYAKQMHEEGELETSPGTMLVEFNEEGAKTSVNLIHMDIDAVKFARKLFTVQRIRVEEILGEVARELYGQNNMSPGSRTIQVPPNAS